MARATAPGVASGHLGHIGAPLIEPEARYAAAAPNTPGSAGRSGRHVDRRPDAGRSLYQRGVVVSIVENAFVLAAARSHPTRRSSAPGQRFVPWPNFLPLIEEVLGMRVIIVLALTGSVFFTEWLITLNWLG
jgi:hypothetical protein